MNKNVASKAPRVDLCLLIFHPFRITCQSDVSTLRRECSSAARTWHFSARPLCQTRSLIYCAPDSTRSPRLFLPPPPLAPPANRPVDSGDLRLHGHRDRSPTVFWLEEVPAIATVQLAAGTRGAYRQKCRHALPEFISSYMPLSMSVPRGDATARPRARRRTATSGGSRSPTPRPFRTAPSRKKPRAGLHPPELR
jgi:hypothetical protein